MEQLLMQILVINFSNPIVHVFSQQFTEEFLHTNHTIYTTEPSDSTDKISTYEDLAGHSVHKLLTTVACNNQQKKSVSTVLRQ